MEKTCHASGCEEIALSDNNLCRFHKNLSARDYKIYKLYHTKCQPMIDDTLSSEKLEALSIDTLIQYCIQLKKMICMRKEYMENYFKPENCDEGHAKFLNFLEERMKLCELTIKDKTQSSETVNKIAPPEEEVVVEEEQPIIVQTSQSKRKHRKKKKSNPNALLDQMIRERKQIIQKIQINLDLITQRLKSINSKITKLVISRVTRFITYSIYTFSLHHNYKKHQVLKRSFCTCEPDSEFYLQLSGLLHLVTNIILHDAENMIPLIDLFMRSNTYESCQMSIFFREKDAQRGLISAIPCVLDEFELDGCPTFDYKRGRYRFGVWKCSKDSSD